MAKKKKTDFWRLLQDRYALLRRRADLVSEQTIAEILEHMDKTDFRKRCWNIWDARFKIIVPVLHKYDFALAFLNRWGNIKEMYFMYVKNPEQNVELQFAICEVKENSYNGKYYLCYSNMLSGYLSKWDLVSEVYEKVFSDDKYLDAQRVYALFRENK